MVAAIFLLLFVIIVHKKKVDDMNHDISVLKLTVRNQNLEIQAIKRQLNIGAAALGRTADAHTNAAAKLTHAALAFSGHADDQ